MVVFLDFSDGQIHWRVTVKHSASQCFRDVGLGTHMFTVSWWLS